MEKKLKKILKAVKLSESSFTMLLGLGVIIVVGGLLVNYFRSKPAQLPTVDDQVITTDVAEQAEFSKVPAEELPPYEGELPTTYRVRAGDNLWKIAERYYQTGYGWVEIVKVNDLSNANAINVDQELVIPLLSKAYPLTVEVREPVIGGGGSIVAEGVDESVAKLTTETSDMIDVLTGRDYGEAISGDSYITKKGDFLWGIAVRAYGDGYKWTEIAQANKLSNPDLIYSGIELALPR